MSWESCDHAWIEEEIRTASRERRKVVRAIAKVDLRRMAYQALDHIRPMPDLQEIVARWGWPKTTVHRLVASPTEWCHPDRLGDWHDYVEDRWTRGRPGREWSDPDWQAAWVALLDRWNDAGTAAERPRDASGTTEAQPNGETTVPRNASGTTPERQRNGIGHTRGSQARRSRPSTPHEREQRAPGDEAGAPAVDPDPAAEERERLAEQLWSKWQEATGQAATLADRDAIVALLTGDERKRRSPVPPKLLGALLAMIATGRDGVQKRGEDWGDVPTWWHRKGLQVLVGSLDLPGVLRAAQAWDSAKRPRRKRTALEEQRREAAAVDGQAEHPEADKVASAGRYWLTYVLMELGEALKLRGATPVGGFAYVVAPHQPRGQHAVAACGGADAMVEELIERGADGAQAHFQAAWDAAWKNFDVVVDPAVEEGAWAH